MDAEYRDRVMADIIVAHQERIAQLESELRELKALAVGASADDLTLMREVLTRVGVT